MSKKTRHYEVVFLIHQDQCDKARTIIEHYETLVKNGGGIIHRLEDWGKLSLAYPIGKLSKANYVLMNIECDDATLKELTNDFHFNEAIIRNLILTCDRAITEPSPMLTKHDKEELNPASLKTSAPTEVEAV